MADIEDVPGKSKAIDALISVKGKGAVAAEVPVVEDDAGDDDGAWPEPPTESKKIEREEDLYDYEEAAPAPRTSVTFRMPRRSSLKTAGPRRASISYSGEMTLRLPTGQTTRRKTSITFNDDEQVQDIEPVTDLVDDPNRLWFQKEEYTHIREKIYAIIASAKNGESDSRTTWLCTRGLEPLMGGSNPGDRREAYESVIEEQKMQKLRGKYDDEYIRTIYQFHTVDAQVIANERAQNDAAAVENYLRVTRKMCRRLSC